MYCPVCLNPTWELRAHFTGKIMCQECLDEVEEQEWEFDNQNDMAYDLERDRIQEERQ